MSNEFEKFCSFIEDVSPVDFNKNWSKYSFMAARFVLEPICLGIQSKNYNNLLALAKKQLPALSKELPDDFLNKKILDFAVTAYKNKNINSFNELLDDFSDENLSKRNIILKLYNLEIEDAFYECEKFSLYRPDIFYEKNIKNTIQNIEDNEYLKNCIIDLFEPKKGKQPLTILVLKNITTYKMDEKITKTIIKSSAIDWLYFFGSIINQFDFLSTSVHHAIEAYSIFTQDMTPVVISDPGEFLSHYYIPPLQISQKELEDHKIILSFFSSTDKFEIKLAKAAKWLGKSKFATCIEDSFLYIAIALECLLSYDDKSFIAPSKTNSLAEGLTFLLEDTLDNRLNIYRDIKEMYGKRSSIVHSGSSSVTNEMKERFFNYVFNGLKKAIELKCNGMLTIDDFRKYIENKKFS